MCHTLFQVQGIQWYMKASSCLAESLRWRVDKKLMKETQETDTKQSRHRVRRQKGSEEKGSQVRGVGGSAIGRGGVM